MPVSTDNQDYGESDKKNDVSDKPGEADKLTSDDLKGKKTDADVEEKSDQPVEQKK